MGKGLYTTFEAAKILGVSPGAVLNWVKSGKVPASRTVGGHYRIQGDKIEELIAERHSHEVAEEPPASQRVFQYCWEFNAKGSQLPEDCRSCLVYRTRAKRCYEMGPVPKELGHMKLYCQSVCEECDYFKHVKDQALNILIVTDDVGMLGTLDDEGIQFNLKATDSEYECSAIIEKFRPDFVVIDCSFHKSRELFQHLIHDHRIPFVKMILVPDSNNRFDFCSNKTIGHISKPLTSERLEKFIGDASTVG